MSEEPGSGMGARGDDAIQCQDAIYRALVFTVKTLLMALCNDILVLPPLPNNNTELEKEDLQPDRRKCIFRSRTMQSLKARYSFTRLNRVRQQKKALYLKPNDMWLPSRYVSLPNGVQDEYCESIRVKRYETEDTMQRLGTPRLVL